MIIQFVQFETTLSEQEVRKVAEDRADQFRAIPGLVQKYYLKLDRPNRYGGFYVWDSAQSLDGFRHSDLARTIPSAYAVVGTPDIDIHTLMFALRG